jgi:hypothetical protein
MLRWLASLLVAAALALGPAYAQQGLLTSGQVLANCTASNAPARACNFVAMLALYGGWSNTRLAKSGAYAAVSADCGSTVALGGSAFYTLTINAASTYKATCAFLVVNEDGGRGKTLAINGLAGFILWPLQTVLVYNDNNVWQAKDYNPRWKLPSNLTLYVNGAAGSDGNDCLAAASGACATIQAAYNLVAANFDLSGHTVTINVADGTISPASGASCLNISAPWTGGGAIVVNGNTTTPDNVVCSTTGNFGHGFQVSATLPGTLTIQGFKIITAGSAFSNSLYMSASGLLQFKSIDFGATATGHIYTDALGAAFVGGGANTISGNAGVSSMVANAGGNIKLQTTITISGTPSVGFTFALATRTGVISADQATFVNPTNLSGASYSASLNGVIYTNGHCASLPGNGTGSTATGGQCQ